MMSKDLRGNQIAIITDLITSIAEGVYSYGRPCRYADTGLSDEEVIAAQAALINDDGGWTIYTDGPLDHVIRHEGVRLTANELAAAITAALTEAKRRVAG